MLLTRLLILAGIMSGLSACFASRPDAPPLIAAVLPTAGSSDLLPLPPDASAIGLQRVQFDIPRGAHIGELRPPPLSLCYGRRLGSIQHDTSRTDDEPREWQDVFYRIMSGHGYRVDKSPENLFEERNKIDAEYIIGANITEAAVNGTALCHIATAEVTGMTGSSKIMVEWQVFDPVRRRIVLREKVEGSYTADRVMPIDYMLMIKMAFADAVNKLAMKPAVRALVATRPVRDVAATPAPAIQKHKYSVMRQTSFTQPIENQMDRLRASTVLIEAGQGHGSGFLISEEGMVVTNHHVVGGHKFVRVTLVSGRTVVGEVLQHDQDRDVALLKIEGQGYASIPVREAPVRIAEEVYAIGAPRFKSLAGTVTRGVVSAWRSPQPPKQPYDLIQADVPTHPGNSGGPLLDRQGNLVGISVAGYRGTQSLNLFIPILDGLDKLGIELVDPQEYRRRRQAAR
jgi:serine protease Do